MGKHEKGGAVRESQRSTPDLKVRENGEWREGDGGGRRWRQGLLGRGV